MTAGEPFHKRKPDNRWFGHGRHWFGMPPFAGKIIEYMHMKDGRGYLVINECLNVPMKASIRKHA